MFALGQGRLTSGPAEIGVSMDNQDMTALESMNTEGGQ